jgi:hypothetical protein
VHCLNSTCKCKITLFADLKSKAKTAKRFDEFFFSFFSTTNQVVVCDWTKIEGDQEDKTAVDDGLGEARGLFRFLGGVKTALPSVEEAQQVVETIEAMLE